MSGLGLSVRFNQTEHRILQGCKSGSRRHQRDGDGRRDVRCHRCSGKAAGAFRTAVDKWAAKQDDQPGCSEAIRRLVELGLKAKGK
jgi:hypothetical protein